MLPHRDLTKSNKEQGLYHKFEVHRVDGSDKPGGRHHGCDYFVLDLDHDQHALVALISYANSVATTHPILAAELRRLIELKV